MKIENRQERQNSKSCIFLILLLVVLCSVQVYITNKLATSGRQLAELDNKAMILEDENRKLLSENVEDLSLNQLKEKAKALGFVEATEILNFTNSALAAK